MGRRAFLIVYCLSGAAALLYQVAWSRLLTLYLGHTVAAGTVLAAFMGGLALGAAVGGRVAHAFRASARRSGMRGSKPRLPRAR